MAIRHKRDTNARRKPKAALVAGPIAFLVTASVVTIGVMAGNPGSSDVITTQDAPTDLTHTREAVVSRSQSRAEASVDGVRFQRAYAVDISPAATRRAVDSAHTKFWTTTVLNLWSTPGDDATQRGLIKAEKPVLVTGREAAGRVEIVVAGKAQWVTSGYLAEHKPKPEPQTSTATRTAPAGLSSAPCPDGSVESGLTSNAVLVYRSVCNAFPQITSYGGYDAHGEHSTGRALDIMVGATGLGTQIAEFLRANAAELHLYDVIWSQQIWTPVRSAEGWRYMPDRGSTTANHYDHVHVSTY